MSDELKRPSKTRVERAWPPRGPMPAAGAKVGRQEVCMVVQAGLSTELWEWLQDRGFRDIRHSPDRRRYREVPRSLVAALFASPRAEWTALLKQAIDEAAKRPLINAGTRPKPVDM